MTRSARLKNSEDFQRVFLEPIKSVDDFFTVLARLNHYHTGRLGLAISKKNSRRAVDRNRLKRIARESFRLHQHSLPGIDLVVLARRRAVTAPNARLFASLSVHFKRIRDKLCVSC